jgi:hypothetical protein
MAQLNQSDITGTNVFESYAPDFFELEGLDPDIAERAQELSQAIDQANQACRDSQAQTANLPRRFARGPGSANARCLSPECASLERLMQDARAFIAQVESQRAEIIRATEDRPW